MPDSSQRKVSIVLPVYNGSRYLRRSVDSCLQQTYRNIELIIVDDCSTDETPDIVRSLNDPRVKYIRNASNQRLPRSLNIGFAASSGDYLTWTSDDNFYLPEAIEKMVAAIEKNGCEFVYADIFAFHDDHWQAAQRDKLDDPRNLNETDCIRACFLYTRNVMNVVGEYDPDMELIEDYDYWVRVSREFELYHLQEPLYYYRYHTKQLYTARYSEISIIEFLFKAKYDFMPSAEVNWHLRNSVIQGSKGLSLLKAVFLRAYCKPRIDKLLKAYKTGAASFTGTWTAIHHLMKSFNWRFSRKHFVFLRWLPPPPKGEWGGLECLMLGFLRRVDYRSSEVTVAVTPGWKNKFVNAMNGLPVKVVESTFLVNKKPFGRFMNMFRLLRRLKADSAVFFQGSLWEFRFPEILAGFFATKNHVFMHENLGPSEPPVKSSKLHFGFMPGLALWWHVPRLFTRLRAYVCRNIITVSHEIKDRLTTLWGYPDGKIEVCYHGVDVDEFCPSEKTRSEVRKKLNISKTETVVIMAARLTQQKRVDRTIKAFDVLCRQCSELKLLIVGGGPLENELKELAGNKQSSSKIQFLGQVNNVSDYLKAGDIFVLSSDNEGFGIALVEAMATGLVCVSTRCPGPNEIIRNGVNGFLVEKSVTGVLEGLKKVLGFSGGDRGTMSQNAREYVRANFEINKNIYKVFRIFHLTYLGKL